MLSSFIAIVTTLAVSYTLNKGQHMEGNIDKVDVKRDHKELIALFYYIELKTMLQILMYEHQRVKGSIK